MPSLGRRQHRVVCAICHYFANREQLCNRVKHEVVISKIINTIGRSPHVFTLGNTLVNAMSQLQRCCPGPHSPANDAASCRVFTVLNGTTARIRTLCCILTVTSSVEWKEGLLSAEYRLFTSSDLLFFTNLARIVS